MVYRPEVDPALCFVLLPLSAPYLGYFDKIIVPACKEMSLNARKADEIYGTRAVISDIWDAIWKSRIVIAIVSDRNPNVNYELGICHTLGIPTILLTKDEKDVPFDYRHRRYIHYKTDDAGWEQRLREAIVSTLRSALDPTSPPDVHLLWPYDTQKLVLAGSLEAKVSPAVSRAQVLKGVEAIEAVVKDAFGPDGRGVSHKDSFGDSVLTRKGSLLIDSVRSRNLFEERGLDTLRKVAKSVQDSAGDYTKTAMLIASEVIRHCEIAATSGAPARNLTEGINKASQAAATHVLASAFQATDEFLGKLAQTGTTDEKLASIVSEALDKVGRDGVIEIVESTDQDHHLTFDEGLTFDRGLFDLALATDSVKKLAIYDNARVLLYDGKIDAMKELLPTLELVARTREPLLIICRELVGEALNTVVINVVKGNLRVAAVRAPGFGQNARNLLNDLSVVTGARVISLENGSSLHSASTDDLGIVSRVVAGQATTTIVGNAKFADEVRTYVDGLRNDLRFIVDYSEQIRIRARIARLVAGIATIAVGGYTPSQKLESRIAANSIVKVSQLARENGLVIGGGVALRQAARFVEQLITDSDAEKSGITAVSRALKIPSSQLIINAKTGNADATIHSLHTMDSRSFGFESKARCVKDLQEVGIYDSAQGLAMAIRLAIAHASEVLNASSWSQAPHQLSPFAANKAGETLNANEPF